MKLLNYFMPRIFQKEVKPIQAESISSASSLSTSISEHLSSLNAKDNAVAHLQKDPKLYSGCKWIDVKEENFSDLKFKAQALKMQLSKHSALLRDLKFEIRLNRRSFTSSQYTLITEYSCYELIVSEQPAPELLTIEQLVFILSDSLQLILTIQPNQLCNLYQIYSLRYFDIQIKNLLSYHTFHLDVFSKLIDLSAQYKGIFTPDSLILFENLEISILSGSPFQNEYCSDELLLAIQNNDAITEQLFQENTQVSLLRTLRRLIRVALLLVDQKEELENLLLLTYEDEPLSSFQTQIRAKIKQDPCDYMKALHRYNINEALVKFQQRYGIEEFTYAFDEYEVRISKLLQICADIPEEKDTTLVKIEQLQYREADSAQKYYKATMLEAIHLKIKGRHTREIDILEKSLKLHQKLLGYYNQNTVELQLDICEIYVEAGYIQQGLDCMKEFVKYNSQKSQRAIETINKLRALSQNSSHRKQQIDTFVMTFQQFE